MTQRNLGFSVLSLVLMLAPSSAMAQSCNAISRSRLVTCACNGFPAIASYCSYYRNGGGCSASMPGNYCGSDDAGHDCYIGTTNGFCMGPQRNRSSAGENASTAANFAALVPTCAGSHRPPKSVELKEKLSLR
jgi:hypothetical protein